MVGKTVSRTIKLNKLRRFCLLEVVELNDIGKPAYTIEFDIPN